MNETAIHASPLVAPTKDFTRRLMTIGENRLDLLMVEVREERERLLHALLLALGVALFAFLAGAALTVALVVLFWSLSPVGVLLILTALYGGAAVLLYRRFTVLQRDWKSFPATLDQLRKDRACLEECLG
jgi:uncharacterized membrane protein YqjE